MEKIPDSKWLSALVAQAFKEDRIDLGAALARLAVQAKRIERSQPAAVAPVSATIYEDVNRSISPAPAHPELHTCHLGVSDPDHPLRTDQAHCAVCVRVFSVPCRNAVGSPCPWGAPECAVPEHGDPHHPGFGGDDPTGLRSVEMTQVATQDAPTEVHAPVVPSARCDALIAAPGTSRIDRCHGVLAWNRILHKWEHLHPVTLPHEPETDWTPGD